MKKKLNHIHRGQVLQAVVEATRFNKEEVAEKAGYTRSSYYKHINDPDLPYSTLIKYGRALNYDFKADIPDMPEYMMEEPVEDYDKELTFEEAKRSIEYWKNKYIDLLERYNGVMEELRSRK